MLEQTAAIISSQVKSNFKLSDLFIDFNCSNVDDFIFDDVELSLSSTGIAFSGQLRMDQSLAIFKNYMESDSSISIEGNIVTDCKELGQKIDPQSATLKCTVPFFKEVFKGVTLTEALFEIDISKKGEQWTIQPRVAGEFDVDNLTDKDPGKMSFELTEKDETLLIAAQAKNLKGAFGLEQLCLNTINIDGEIGKTNSLNINSDFIVGVTTLKMAGILTEDTLGIRTEIDSFELNDLPKLFSEISTNTLNLPEFDITFKTTSLALASSDCKIGSTNVKSGFTLSSQITAHGHTIDTTAQISSNGVVFDGSLSDIKVGPVDITKTDLNFEIYKKAVQKPTKFEISGEAVIEGITVDCGVYFEKNNKWDTVLYAKLSSDTFELSDVFPPAKDSFVDELKFSEVGFIYASADCQTKNAGLNYSVKKGLQLMGVLEEIPGLSDLTGEKHVGLVLSAHIGTTTDISIAMSDTCLNLGHSVVCDPFTIQITITPNPALMLVFGMDVTVPKQTTPLHFDMALSLGAIEASGSVTMKNYWQNPFGIDGLKIGPALALQIGIIYEQFIATGIPSEFGFAGGLAIGDTVVDMAVNISENPTEEILMGKLEELGPSQLIDFAANLMDVKIPDVPNFFELKELELYCAPSGGSIGTITYEPGFSFSGDLVIAGKEISVYTRVSDTGVEGAGHIDNLSFGPLKISGEKGKDAEVDLELTLEKQSLLIDGCISFLGVKEGVYVDVSNKGIAFKFSQDFFGQLKYDIEGESSGSISDPSSLDFKLSGEMDNNITSYLKTEIAGKIDDVLNATEASIDDAEADVEKARKKYEAKFVPAQKALNKAQDDADKYLDKLSKDLKSKKADYAKKVGAAQKDVGKAKKKYDKAFNDAKSAVSKAQKTYNNGMKSAKNALTKAQRTYNNGMKSAQKEVNKAEKKYNDSIGAAQRSIDSASRKCNKLKKHHYNWGTTLAAYGIAKGVLASAKLFLEGLKHGVDYTAFQSAKSALKVAKTGANYVAFKATKEALEVAKTGVNYTSFESAKATLELVKNGSDYTVWQAAEKTLSAVKIAGQKAIDEASDALNDIGKSAVYVAVKTAKAELKAIEEGTEAAAFGTAKAALETAKLGSEAVLELGEYVAKHAGDLIDIKRFKISGSLKEVEKGNLFDAELDISLLGHEYDWAIDFDVKQVEDFIEALFKKALNELKKLV